MNKKPVYDTVTEATADLIKRGYDQNFKASKQNCSLVCNSEELSPDLFQIDEIHRFEGMTNPEDSMIVYAISSKDNNTKGILTNGYGVYADDDTNKLVEALDTPK